MSYQDYQFSWPSGSYDYSYNTSQQYTTTTDSQGQYTTTDNFSVPSTNLDYHQYETSFNKTPLDTTGYLSGYTTDVTTGSDSTMGVAYSGDQFSTYSSQNEPTYQSQMYQYSNSQIMQDSLTPNNDMAYISEKSFDQSYDYNKPSLTQVDTSSSNNIYGTEAMDTGYNTGGSSISYNNDFSGSLQWNTGTGIGSSSDTYYPRAEVAGSSMTLGGGLVDLTSSYSGEMASNTSGIYESTSNYFPQTYEAITNKTSYTPSSYQSQGLASTDSSYSNQGDRGLGGSNNFSRGGLMSRSGMNRGSSSSNFFSGTYSKPTQSPSDVSRDEYRSGDDGSSQFANNSYTNSRSRGLNMPLSNPRSRGNTSFSRGLNGSRFNSSRGNSYQAKGPNTVQRGNQRRGSFGKPTRYSNSDDQPQRYWNSDKQPPKYIKSGEQPTRFSNNSNPKAAAPVNSATPRPGAKPSETATQAQQKPSGHQAAEKKEKVKAPSRPQDKLLNEIEEKEKAEKLEKESKEVEEKEKAEKARKAAEEARKAEEEAQNKIMEEARLKAEEMARKMAPPSKAPETAEEIAKEEEIQRKIRESVVVVDPTKDTAILIEDPVKGLQMPDELRKQLKTLTSDTLCKLCSLRMIGPHMAPMHYKGKNHLKKVRTFIQSNGRSAGLNMETAPVSDESTSAEKKEGETEKEEEMEVDEKKYCKICKVSFSHPSQCEMHYKGKNHAKKVRTLANSSEVFECKICSVTVTAQEHLTAHLNGARHKLQIRKNSRGDTTRGRGGFYGRGGRGGGMGNFENGFWRGGDGGADLFPGRGGFNRGRGRGRGGFKRPGDQNGLGPFNKRPRF